MALQRTAPTTNEDGSALARLPPQYPDIDVEHQSDTASAGPRLHPSDSPRPLIQTDSSTRQNFTRPVGAFPTSSQPRFRTPHSGSEGGSQEPLAADNPEADPDSTLAIETYMTDVDLRARDLDEGLAEWEGEATNPTEDEGEPDRPTSSSHAQAEETTALEPAPPYDAPSSPHDTFFPLGLPGPGQAQAQEQPHAQHHARWADVSSAASPGASGNRVRSTSNPYRGRSSTFRASTRPHLPPLHTHLGGVPRRSGPHGPPISYPSPSSELGFLLRSPASPTDGTHASRHPHTPHPHDPSYSSLHTLSPVLAPPTFVSRYTLLMLNLVPPDRPTCALLLLSVSLGIYLILDFTFPTTVHLFLPAALFLAGWVALTWSKLATTLFCSARVRQSATHLALPQGWHRSRTPRGWVGLGVATALVMYWMILGISPPTLEVPYLPAIGMAGHRERYFIAAMLYNNADILPAWSEELVKLALHLGREDVYISIYESNSIDTTKSLLSVLSSTLSELGIEHRIKCEDNDRRVWPYPTSPARIAYLAEARNEVLKPLQAEHLRSSEGATQARQAVHAMQGGEGEQKQAPFSDAEDGRLEDWNEYTKILWLNDVLFTWQDAVRLIATKVYDHNGQREEYDQVCGIDYCRLGLYDTWIARDTCGTPLRAAWPYVTDKPSQELVRKEQPFPVAACWNGIVVFRAEPFLWSPPPPPTKSEQSGLRESETSGWSDGVALAQAQVYEEGHPEEDGRWEGIAGRRLPRKIMKRGWKMLDNSSYLGEDSRLSPSIHQPLQFRTSGIDACDHSECFLISYDLHRLQTSSSSPDSKDQASQQGPSRIPRIYMNPTVRVAYEDTWYRWNTVWIRRPVVKWWLNHWAHSYPRFLLDWLWERVGRNRDHCTWAGFQRPDRCPALPGPKKGGWGKQG